MPLALIVMGADVKQDASKSDLRFVFFAWADSILNKVVLR
jgi:hypothetical protein